MFLAKLGPKMGHDSKTPGHRGQEPGHCDQMNARQPQHPEAERAMTDETTPPTDSSEERSDLADLVQARMAELGIGLRPLAAASIDPEDPSAGPLWTRGTLSNLMAGERVKAPRLPELRALAAGLRLPLRALQDAAGAQFFGIDTVYADDQQTRVLLRHFDQLGEDDRAKVIAIMEALRHT